MPGANAPRGWSSPVCPSPVYYPVYLVVLSLLVLPGLTWAGWGQENWGAMVLTLGLAATAAWTLRKRRPALGLLLVLAQLLAANEVYPR